MTRILFLEEVLELLNNPKNKSLKLSRANTHLKGIFSLVIDGNDFGQLTRIYIVDREINPYEVQLHTHRYPISITTIKGNIRHHIATPASETDTGSIQISEFEYRSPLNDGDGLTYSKESNVVLNDYWIPPFTKISLSEDDFHTISCSSDSIWIIEEKGFKTDFNRVLGVPFETDNLYDIPEKHIIETYRLRVTKEIKRILDTFYLNRIKQ